MVKSITKEFLYQTIDLLTPTLENTESAPSMILLMKSKLSDHTSRKPTTSSGLSNLEAQEEDSAKRDILSKEEVTGVTENFTSTILSRECFDLFKINILYTFYFIFIQ